jgi:hypothetical protein
LLHIEKSLGDEIVRAMSVSPHSNSTHCTPTTHSTSGATSCIAVWQDFVVLGADALLIAWRKDGPAVTHDGPLRDCQDAADFAFQYELGRALPGQTEPRRRVEHANIRPQKQAVVSERLNKISQRYPFLFPDPASICGTDSPCWTRCRSELKPF